MSRRGLLQTTCYVPILNFLLSGKGSFAKRFVQSRMSVRITIACLRYSNTSSAKLYRY